MINKARNKKLVLIMSVLTILVLMFTFMITLAGAKAAHADETQYTIYTGVLQEETGGENVQNTQNAQSVQSVECIQDVQNVQGAQAPQDAQNMQDMQDAISQNSQKNSSDVQPIDSQTADTTSVEDAQSIIDEYNAYVEHNKQYWSYTQIMEAFTRGEISADEKDELIAQWEKRSELARQSGQSEPNIPHKPEPAYIPYRDQDILDAIYAMDMYDVESIRELVLETLGLTKYDYNFTKHGTVNENILALDTLDKIIAFYKSPDLTLRDRKAVFICENCGRMLTLLLPYLENNHNLPFDTYSVEINELSKKWVNRMVSRVDDAESFIEAVQKIEDKVKNSPAYGANEIFYCEELLADAQAKFDVLDDDQVKYAMHAPRLDVPKNYVELFGAYRKQFDEGKQRVNAEFSVLVAQISDNPTLEDKYAVNKANAYYAHLEGPMTDFVNAGDVEKMLNAVEYVSKEQKQLDNFVALVNRIPNNVALLSSTEKSYVNDAFYAFKNLSEYQRGLVSGYVNKLANALAKLR